MIDCMAEFNYSVIVPYRDKYDLFIKAIGSIPDRSDIQIIIVDNSLEPLSVDAIPVKESACVDYTTSSTTKGAGCARNIGLSHVKGKYVLFLDADDYFANEAFNVFDTYLDKDYDIVFFNTNSIRLSDGKDSKRHLYYSNCIAKWISTRDESRIRYRWAAPWAKLYRSSFVLNGNFQFEEKPVMNDAWFSLMAGHAAHKVFADNAVVYVVTEAESGQSLTKTVTRENSFLRYDTRIKINKFLKSIGRYDMRIRLLGTLRLTLMNFGAREVFRYLRYARENGVGVF